MANVVHTSLTKFELNDEEMLAGHTLTTYNKYALQNMIADLSEQKLGLKFNPNEQLNFIQDEAFVSGKIEVLKQLLELAEEVSIVRKEQ